MHGRSALTSWARLGVVFVIVSCARTLLAGPQTDGIARPMATHVAWERLWRAEQQPIEIPVGHEPQRVELSLPPLPAKPGKTVCLRFEARLHTNAPAGWNNYLALMLNGRSVHATNASRRPRLLNRRAHIRTSHPSESRFPAVRLHIGLPCLVMFFGPDFQALDQRVLSAREELYWYLLDVSDLVEGQKGNTLELTNTALRRYWNGKPPGGLRLVVDNLEAGHMDADQAESLRAVWLEKRTLLPGCSVEGKDLKVTAVAGAGLQLELAGESYFIESAFSHPGGGRNMLSCLPSPAAGEPSWKPSVRRVDASTLEVSAAGAYYALSRRVGLKGHRIEVDDTFLNKAKEATGIIVRHQVITPEVAESYRLGGVERAVLRGGGSPENPTLFAAQSRTGLGVLAEDNVFRVQLGAEVEANSAALFTEHFGLRPQARYTLKWTIYPGGTDYFDFINAVRRDWKVNFTVLGPFEFVGSGGYQSPKEADKLKAYLRRKRLRIFALSPWFEYYSGYRVSREQYKQQERQAIATIKSVQPDALCIAMLETNLVPVPLSFFQGALPKDWGYGRAHGGRYGIAAPAEATKVIDASPWRDSCLRDEKARVVLDTWYVGHYKEPPALNLMVYPERFDGLGRPMGNHRHQQMMEQLKFCLDEVGFDGVYIDQFSAAYGGRDHYTYERWDGHTVDIDPQTGRVTRQYADLALISAPARRQWVEYVLSKGKIVVANSMPAVNELQSLPVFRFMETQGYLPTVKGIPDASMCAKGQLGSPIGLGYAWGYSPSAGWGAKPKGADFFVRTVIAHLRYGMLYYYYGATFPADGELGGEYGPVNHMFPFTPVELHEGWVVGQERIVTCVSGEFEWKRAARPTAILFDARGREKACRADVTKGKGRVIVRVQLKDWEEVAVIK